MQSNAVILTRTCYFWRYIWTVYTILSIKWNDNSCFFSKYFADLHHTTARVVYFVRSRNNWVANYLAMQILLLYLQNRVVRMSKWKLVFCVITVEIVLRNMLGTELVILQVLNICEPWTVTFRQMLIRILNSFYNFDCHVANSLLRRHIYNDT